MKPILLSLCLFSGVSLFGAQAPSIEWIGWSNDLFQKAKAEKKLVLLDLEAVWCHWCHVMEKETYSDPRVIQTIREHFIAVKVDQDSRPDLSRRYENFGWPATVFFASDGRELAKRRGFQEAQDLLDLMEALVKNPVAEHASKPQKKVVPESPFLTKPLKEKLQKGHLAQYDTKQGGWGSVHKLLFGESEEWAMRGAWKGNKDDAARGKETLRKALALVDPAWGGIYQYSVHDWKTLHFEKIASAQTRGLTLYSLGYSLWKDPRFLKTANSTRAYLNAFLKAPNGAYYTSQDADLEPGKHSDSYFKLSDAKRRKLGVPRVDENQYARENGWFIYGLCALYAATSDDKVLEDAKNAALWVLANRSLEGGGFRHDSTEANGPYLGDTLAMGQALLALYEVTGDRTWLEHARKAGLFLSRFQIKEGETGLGFATNLGDLGGGLVTEPSRDENIDVARLGNRLFRYTGDKAFEAIALAAMRFLVTPGIVEEYPTAGVLLADEELTSAPVHLTVVGAKSDPAARALFQEANRYPSSYKRVEWWDKAEGDLPSQDVKYPQMKKAAAYACTDGRCSLPVFDPKELRAKVDQLYR